jgi:hypothetical protein
MKVKQSREETLLTQCKENLCSSHRIKETNPARMREFETQKPCATFKVLTEMLMRIQVFWDVLPY